MDALPLGFLAFIICIFLLLPARTVALNFKRPSADDDLGGIEEAAQLLRAAGVTDESVLRRFAEEDMDVKALLACRREDLNKKG